MEKMLLKLARQLESLDEASLMALWSKYATITSHFEPSKRWEDACLIFSLIQAKHWKNQLFNYCWSQQRMPPNKGPANFEPPSVDIDFGIEKEDEDNFEKPEAQPCKILNFMQSKNRSLERNE